MGDMSAEPSMEEILSSIKRIIAEEGEGPVRARRGGRPLASPEPASHADDLDEDDDGEVLELSDPIPPAPQSAPVAATMPAEPHAAAAPDFPEEPTAMADSPVEAPAMPRAARSASTPAASAEPILSSRAAEASRNSLDSLSRLMVRADAPAGDDNTLEGLVRAMLRPMLREWLDANLPAMVETMVAAEIKRITGQAR